MTRGEVVGKVGSPNSSAGPGAFVHRNGSLTLLGSPGSTAWAINNTGGIVGDAFFGGSLPRRHFREWRRRGP